MTPKERMTAAIRHESPDTVPIAPYLIGDYTTKLMTDEGLDPSDSTEFNRRAAESYREHGCDWMLLFFGEDYVPVDVIEKNRDEYFLARGCCAPYTRGKATSDTEDFLVALKKEPARIKDECEINLEKCLKEAQSAAKLGIDGIWLEEGLCSSDIISPDDYQEFAFPYEKRLIDAIEEAGLVAMLYFCGDIMPLLPSIKDLAPDVLSVEESKKNFELDVVEIRKELGKEICLFGNLDAVGLLLKGDRAGIEAELKRQMQCADADGGFIVGTGSPVAYATAPETVDYFVETALKSGRERLNCSGVRSQ
ncbi:uroporphyrinogen decarboxylase family protein [Verrucomicrobiota bacterium]